MSTNLMFEDSDRGSKEKLTMYSPKELEGEVDHSFFDSDCDAIGSQSEEPVHQEKEDRDGTNEQLPDQSECSQLEKTVERRGKLEIENPGLEGQSGLDLMGGSDHKGQTRLKKTEVYDRKKKNQNKTAEGKEDSDASLSSHSDMSSPSDISSSGESEDDGAALERRKTKPTKRSGRKLLNLLRRRSSSSSSRERSPTPRGRTSNASLTRSPRQQQRPVSADQKQKHKTSERVESDDTVTDVTPLSSPDISPQQTLNLALLPYPEQTLPVPPTRTLDSAHGHHLDAKMNGKERSAVLSVGRQMDSALLVSNPGVGGRTAGSGRRKNYSFTSDEVRRIERENQRLLHELSRTSAFFSSQPARRASVPSSRLYHSGLNRLRDQERIQRENMAFLKRLESVKATPGMTRSEQLTDYQRQAGYLRAPTFHIRPTSGRTSKSCNSASPHRARSQSANPTGSAAPGPAKDLMV